MNVMQALVNLFVIIGTSYVLVARRKYPKGTMGRDILFGFELFGLVPVNLVNLANLLHLIHLW